MNPIYTQWNQSYAVDDEGVDERHKAILAQCNALADCVAETSPDNDLKFKNIFDELMVNARELFQAEENLLARCGYPALEEVRDEGGEFEYLVTNIATVENFDKVELQQFLASWWAGHLVDFSRKYRKLTVQTSVQS